MTDNEETLEVKKSEKKNELDGKERRLLRVDQIKDRQIHFVKTAKAGLSKANQERFNKTILVVRRVISKQGMVARTEVDVKSTLLRDILLDIHKDVDGLELHKSPPVADPKLLYYSLSALALKKQQETEKPQPDATLIEHLSTAIQYVYEDFGSRIADLGSLLPHKEITYDLLWMLLPAKTLVYTEQTLLNQPQVMQVTEIDYHEGQDGVYLNVWGHTIAHDGEDFGTTEQKIQIPAYDGARKLEDLAGFPLKYHTWEAEIRSGLLERGRKFVSLLDPICQEYTGAGAIELDTGGKNKIQKFNVWAAFAVSQIRQVTWNEKAFEKLVIGPRQRTLVHALVKAHGRGHTEQDDIIQDKGKGLIGLLSGSPGVGKTLTAEAVAEVTKRPLYMISAGELGKDLEAVDKRLDTVLSICRTWKCVLLLDEADVFLQARDIIDLERNAMVSIFLRRLEYYQGILILTTNRIKSIDPAFQSRIHFSIQYPDLDTASRRIIWHNFINSRAEPSTFTEDEIDKLADWDLNGRQIKNAVACASSLAWEEGATLALRHVDNVLEAFAEFSTAVGDARN
ncbi:MAG: hypothetical protein Q9220_005984 [cf. Caloplaca sp. 1 TL-2023]